MENISKPVCVTVNGVVYNRTVSTAMTLLDFIRDELKLKGTKRSCDNGECGACSVIMDDELVYSCHVLAVQADGSDIVTIEGLSSDQKLSPIHEALMDEGAIQCGYCTPGMVLAIKKLLDEHPDPTESEIKYGLAGNICRCTGYVSIENAVKKAAAVLRGE
mgnify:FL=1